MSSDKHIENNKKGTPIIQSLLPFKTTKCESNVQESGGPLKYTDVQIKTKHKKPTNFLSYLKFNWRFPPFS